MDIGIATICLITNLRGIKIQTYLLEQISHGYVVSSSIHLIMATFTIE